MTSYFHFVLRHRVLVLCICAVATLLSLASISRAVIATSIGKLFLGESPAYKDYLSRAHAFGNDEILIIGLDVPDILEPKRQAQLRAAVEQVEAIPAVDRVESILRAQHMTLDDDTLRVGRYADEAAEEPDRIPELLSAIRKDPLAGGLILSGTGRQSAVIVELKPDPHRPVEEGPRIVEKVLGIFEHEGFSKSELHRAGLLAVLSEVLVQTNYNIKRIFPFVALILFLTVWILFRRFWPGVVSLGVALLSVIWTAGFAIQLDRKVDILMSMAPAVILIVSFSDVVHLCSAYLIELGHGIEKKAAILKSAEDVGRGCFYTSLTTFAGFICLSLVPVPIFRKAGIVLGFGVASALVLAMTLVPVVFSLMKEPAPLRRGATSFVHQGLDWVLKEVQAVTTGRPRTVIAVFIAFMVLCLIGLLRLRIETDFVRRLGETNPVRKDQAWFDTHFAGTNTLDIYVETPEADGLLDAGLFRSIASFQDRLEHLPAVDKGISLADLMKEIHKTLNADEKNLDPLPDNRPALAQYLLLFEMGGGEELDRFIDFDRQTMRILLRLPSGGFRAAASIGSQAVSLGKEMLGDSATVQPTGLAYLLGNWLDHILAGQRNGILASLFLVTVMMALAVRSPGVGLWAMLPNVLPLLALGGYVGGFWDQVDSDALMIAYVAVGIGVDDTIHFLIRYRLEQARTNDTKTAIRRTFNFAGRAIIMTTIILVAGFLPFATSDYFTIRILGTLLPMCLVVALLGDLFLLPAMVQQGLIRFRETAPAVEEPSSAQT